MFPVDQKSKMNFVFPVPSNPLFNEPTPPSAKVNEGSTSPKYSKIEPNYKYDEIKEAFVLNNENEEPVKRKTESKIEEDESHKKPKIDFNISLTNNLVVPTPQVQTPESNIHVNNDLDTSSLVQMPESNIQIDDDFDTRPYLFKELGEKKYPGKTPEEVGFDILYRHNQIYYKSLGYTPDEPFIKDHSIKFS